MFISTNNYIFNNYNNNGDYMNKIKNNLRIIIPIILFSIISVITIYSSSTILQAKLNDLYLKQIIWYIIGFIIILFLARRKNGISDFTINILYIIGNISLLLVLFLGSEVNGARCWFTIPKIGSVQPSEFMKIFLILMISKELNKYNNENYNQNIKTETIIIIKCLLLTLIPTILTFLEPDTGIVFIYFIILFIILFVFGIRYRWFIVGISIISLFIGTFLYLFFIKQDLFINMFGTDFFYRMDRLLDWSNGEGMQLTNALASTGSAGLYGYGIKNNPIYYPEAQTDFIFSVFSTNFGFFGSILFIILLIIFDLQIIRIGIKAKKKDKYIIAGIISMIIYQQIQNIGMNIGLLPITGITLPFISYGGSSLISYMGALGIVLNIINKKSETIY